jgi:hypothetical protein
VTARPARTLVAALLAGVLLAAALLVVTPATAVVATAADAPTTQPATATQSTVDTRPCEDDGYEPPALDREWDPGFVDSLDDASRTDWAGGRVVRVGATGDCSLAALDGETVTLTAATVDGTRGVLTGTLDLGANGSLALVAVNGSTPTAVPTASDPATSNRGVALALSNDGPDFASSVVVTSSVRSTRVALPTGRFFHFAVRRDGGTTRVAVWGGDEAWDGQWDVEFGTATESADWRVRLRSQAFLDGVAIGVGEGPGPGETAGPDGTPVRDDPDDDPFPADGFDPGEVSNDEQDAGGSGTGQAVLGFVLVVFGAVNVRYARGITRFGEQLDAIGSKTRMSEVEAADWNVALTKVVGVVLAVVGLGMIVAGVL